MYDKGRGNEIMQQGECNKTKVEKNTACAHELLSAKKYNHNFKKIHIKCYELAILYAQKFKFQMCIPQHRVPSPQLIIFLPMALQKCKSAL